MNKEQIKEQIYEYNAEIIEVYDLAEKLDVDELKSIIVSFGMQNDFFIKDLSDGEYKQIVSDVIDKIIELKNQRKRK